MGCLNGPEIETLEDGRSLADLVSQPVEMAARPQALDPGQVRPMENHTRSMHARRFSAGGWN